MSWKIKGSYMETCSCDLMCPCNVSFDRRPTYGSCQAALVFNIAQGQIEGEDVTGCKVVAMLETPGPMIEGNWKLGMFIDDQASDEQFDKLVQLFGGQLGGPMAGVAPLVGEMLGVERASIEVQEDGLRHSVRVGNEVEFEIEDVVPVTREQADGPVHFAAMGHPVATELTMAEARHSNINAFGIQYEGRTGLSTAEFSWAA